MRIQQLTKAVVALAAVLGSASALRAAESVVVAGVEIRKDPEVAKLLPEKYTQRGLRAHYNPPQPPFLMLGEGGAVNGLLIDMANAMAMRLGTTITMGRVTHDSIIPSLQSGNYDFALGTDADTEGRQKVVDFVDYMQYGLSLVVKEGNPQKLASGKDLCGKRLAVLKGWSPPNYFDSLTVDCKARGLPAVNVITLPNTSDTILAVRSGTADATFVSVPTALGAAKALEGGKVIVVLPEGRSIGWNVQMHGLMVVKQNAELSKALAAAVNSLMADGTMKKLFAHYKLDLNMVLDRAVINQALPDTGLN